MSKIAEEESKEYHIVWKNGVPEAKEGSPAKKAKRKISVPVKGNELEELQSKLSPKKKSVQKKSDEMEAFSKEYGINFGDRKRIPKWFDIVVYRKVKPLADAGKKPIQISKELSIEYYQAYTYAQLSQINE